ncbi:MAG: isoprenylcysteine carboxylmethyltransferase family protein [Hyphomonadaceae bacterium]
MNKASALIGSAAFFVIAPGSVAGLIPWLITHWRAGEDADGSKTVAGAVFVVIGLAMLIESFVRFAVKGEGTPAPVAPPRHLVATGLYRFVRNPMYVAVTLLILGQMLIFANAALMAYAIAIWFCFHLFILLHEEPALRAKFGDEYLAYCEHVPRWIPRLTPWRGA